MEKIDHLTNSSLWMTLAPARCSPREGKLRLPGPGKYNLTPIAPNPGALPHATPPQSVTVETGKYTRVTIRYNSGIS